jgi:hypothetical protein
VARSYRYRGPTSARSVLAVVCTAAGCALLLAIGWPYLGKLGRLALVGAAARGAIVGGALAVVVERSQLPRPRLAGALAAVATLAAILGTMASDYHRDRLRRIREIDEGIEFRASLGTDVDELAEVREQKLSELDLRAYLAHSFGFSGPASDGASKLFGPRAGVLLFGFESVIAMLLAAYYAAGRASEPACPRCGRWLHEGKSRRARYGVTERITSALVRGATDDAARLLEPPDTSEYLELSLARCPAGHEGVVLRLREHFLDRKSRGRLHRHRHDIELSSAERATIEERLDELET